MKSRGFNIEDKHLTELERIAKLLSVVANTFVWAYLAVIDTHMNVKLIQVKKA